MNSTAYLLTKNHYVMKLIIKKSIPTIITVLMCFVCYFSGKVFLTSGNNLCLFVLHIIFIAGLVLYVPKLLCGRRISFFYGYMIEMLGGFVIVFINGSNAGLIPIYEMGMLDLFFCDVYILIIIGCIMISVSVFFEEKL